MSGFSAWILSIAGVATLGVLIDLILPSNKTQKYVKTVYSFFVVFVVVSPLPKLINKDYSISDIFDDGGSFELQEDFLFEINRSKLDDLSSDIENILNQQNIFGVKIYVSADIFTTNMKIEAVFVDLFGLVLTPEIENIDINETIILAVQTKIDIERENIIFNE